MRIPGIFLCVAFPPAGDQKESYYFGFDASYLTRRFELTVAAAESVVVGEALDLDCMKLV